MTHHLEALDLVWLIFADAAFLQGDGKLRLHAVDAVKIWQEQPASAAFTGFCSSIPQTFFAYRAKRSGSSGQTYRAHASQTAERLAPCATSYLALSSCPSL